MHTSFTHKQYRHLFLKAASTVWQNKLLVIPGLFISLLANLGFFELFIGNVDNLLPRFNWTFLYPIISFQALAARLSALNILTTGFLFLAVFAMVFGIFFLSAWALGTIILFVKHLAENKIYTWQKAIKDARKFIWPILLVAIIAKAISYISLNLISVPLLKLLANASAINYIFYFSAFVLFMALSILVSVLMYYTILFLILKKMPLIKAVEAALMLVSRQWLTTIEFALLLLLINIGTTLAFGFLASLLAFPFMLFIVVAGAIKSQLVLVAATTTLLLVFMGTLILMTGFIMAFYISSWTLLFLNIEENLSAKLHRLFSPFTFLYKKLFS